MLPADNNLVDQFLLASTVPVGRGHTEGDLREANAILESSPDIARQSLFAAAVLGQSVHVERFLKENKTNASMKGGPRNWDALTYLCFSRYLRLDRSRSNGFEESTRLLLEAGADPNTGFIETGQLPAYEPVLYGAAGVAHHAGVTRLLLEAGADPNDTDGEVFYHAAETHDMDVLRVLVESGKMSAGNLAGMLLRKADWHHTEGIEYLLHHGVDPNRITQWGYSALHQAVRRDNELRAIELMLDHNGDINRKTNTLPSVHPPMTSLEFAIVRGRGDIIQSVRKRGQMPQLTGLMANLAACACHDSEWLRQHKSDVRIIKQLGPFAGAVLGQFAGNGNVQGVAALLEQGIDIEAVWQEGDGYFGIAPMSRPLHVAAWRMHPDVVKFLLEQGAAVDSKDGHGRTPLWLAIEACTNSHWMNRRTPAAVKHLLAAGADRKIVQSKFPTGYAAIDQLFN